MDWLGGGVAGGMGAASRCDEGGIDVGGAV